MVFEFDILGPHVEILDISINNLAVFFLFAPNIQLLTQKCQSWTKIKILCFKFFTYNLKNFHFIINLKVKETEKFSPTKFDANQIMAKVLFKKNMCLFFI